MRAKLWWQRGLIESAGRLKSRRVKSWLEAGRVESACRAARGRHKSQYRNEVRLLLAGHDAFRAMETAIESARTSVHIEMYMILDDTVGRRMVETLVRAARRGVDVRLIYDPIGSIGTGARLFRELRRAGGMVRPFHAPRFGTSPWELVRRNHRKLLCIDGRRAIVGGINWSSQSLPESEAGGGGWYDLAVDIEGPAVGEIEVFFWRSWIYCGGAVPENLKPFFPRPRRRGRARVFARTSFRIMGRFTVYHALLSAISAAERRIEFMQSYFVPPGRLRRALEDASRRGVELDVVVPANSDVQIAQAASRALYHRLLDSGVAIHEVRGPMMHAKTVLIDGWRAFIGSSNINYRSFRLNLELSVEIHSRSFGRSLEREFRKLESTAHRVTRQDIRQWDLLRRLYNHFCYLFRFWI